MLFLQIIKQVVGNANQNLYALTAFVLAVGIILNACSTFEQQASPTHTARPVVPETGRETQSDGREVSVEQVSGLAIHPGDPHRFLYEGEPWYLIGYSPKIGAILYDQNDYDRFYREYIDTLVENRLNYFRNVFNMGQPYGEAPDLYLRTGPGKAAGGGEKFNLDALNPEFFDYWRKVLEYANEKGVVIQFVIFDSWHNKADIVSEKAPGFDWGMKFDYYHGKNNVNGLDASSPEDWHNPEHPVFEFQKALVQAVVDEYGDLPNIIFEISNENYVNHAWELALADYLTEYEISQGIEPHLVMPRDLPNHDNAGGKYNVISEVYRELFTNRRFNQPLIADNDGGGSTSPDGQRRKAWAALTAGGHINYFNGSLSDLETLRSEDVRKGMRYLGYVNQFLGEYSIDLSQMHPCPRSTTQGWCYGSVGREYIIYLLEGGSPEVVGLPVEYTATWFNPRTGEGQAAQNGPVFQAPDESDWVLYIRAD